MGKIHKALEKSKKEQQQATKNPYGSLNARLKERRRQLEARGGIDGRSDRQPISDSKLESIHALLDDSETPQITQRAQTSLKDSVEDHEKRITAQQPYPTESSVDTGRENKVDSGVTAEAKSARPTPSPEKYNGTDTEPAASTAAPLPQDRMAQKIVSLKDTYDESPKIQYLRGDDRVSPRDHAETAQPQFNTQKTVRLHYSLVTLAKPKSFEAEQFKILRANLLFPKSGKTPKTILLTSAVPGEGKTFTAMNLAVSLAQNLNSYVLLVDADIRKPEIHKRFGLRDNLKGLSDFLTRNTPISSLLVKTPVSNLTILPGGQATLNPSELISSERMKMLLTELSTRYSDRFVIIDAPPPKLAAETYALARFVEHIIPVVRSDRSNRDLVEEMMNLLGRDKIHGVVLNCYDIRKNKRFGYHKYSEYYSK